MGCAARAPTIINSARVRLDGGALKQLFALTIAALLLAGCASQIQPAEKPAALKIVTEDFPPYNYLDANGKVAGRATAVVQGILSHLGQSSSIELHPFSESYAMLQSGPNVAFYSVGRTPERESLFKWVGPVGQWELTLYAKSGSALASSFAGAPDAASKMALARDAKGICVVKDDVRHQYLLAQNFANLDVVLEDSACPSRVASGQDELWFGSSTSFSKIVSEAGASHEAFAPVYLVQTNGLYIAFSRDVPGSTVEAWQGALDEMNADGTFGS